ncbi:DUF177 domain-containing protein (plasmid) [Pseudorhodobacter turbinis]|uniref:DUF177 domain-containing protein n=1 Tax=Pseudorhodobacter turbinis TaxID=2500533 RepID=A0A4P8EJF6_9RHOB|nr:DUF177 domain-containing protein [Pseudorhodobacter turbinis]QCO56835.1 DUF177 domain-containing protein [Pseudorhodobacter turbinis]
MTQSNDKSPDYRIAPIPFTDARRVADLSSRKPTRFDLAPDRAMRVEIAKYLEITSASKLRLTGEIRPRGRHDFTLQAVLEASVEQPCSITLAPVISEIKEDVLRVFVADWKDTDRDDMQMTEDDSMEPLGEAIDLGHVTVEALSLALPAFPRAPGAVLDEAQFAAPGTAPLRDGDLKPFAGLAGLKAKLEQGNDPDNDDNSENGA